MPRRARSGSLIVAMTMLVGAATGVTAAAGVTQPAEDLLRAEQLRVEINERYLAVPSPRLVVREASTTGTIESFALLSARLDEIRFVDAANGIFYASCPLRARCPYPARRFARPAAELLPRRQALELVLRTLLETSADVVAVSLPTPRYVLFIVERDELGGEAEIAALLDRLAGDPGAALPRALERAVDELTRPRVFVALGLEPAAGGGVSIGAMPRWPTPAL